MGFHQLTGRVVHHPINATLERVTAILTQIAPEALDAETITAGELDSQEVIGDLLPIVVKRQRPQLQVFATEFHQQIGRVVQVLTNVVLVKVTVILTAIALLVFNVELTTVTEISRRREVIGLVQLIVA